jgi:DNA-directed RNA polymerase specialized sigma24 family protein
VFDIALARNYSTSSRVAAVHAAKVVARYGLPDDHRQDLKQEALLELCRKAPLFDERRASWGTFSERVVANRLASLLRRMHSGRSGHGRQDPLEDLELPNTANYCDIDLQTDVRRVLDGVTPFDRSVGQSLMDYTAIETSHRLRVARATVYRAIERLRAAFTAAGFTGPGRSQALRSSVGWHNARP